MSTELDHALIEGVLSLLISSLRDTLGPWTIHVVKSFSNEGSVGSWEDHVWIDDENEDDEHRDLAEAIQLWTLIEDKYWSTKLKTFSMMDYMDPEAVTMLLTPKWERNVLTIICEEPKDPSTFIMRHSSI